MVPIEINLGKKIRSLVGSTWFPTAWVLAPALIIACSAGPVLGQFTEDAKLAPADLGSGDNFGEAAAICGSTAVVCAPHQDIGGDSNVGACYVFERSDSSWVQVAKLTASDGNAVDWFGHAVGCDVDTIVIGAPEDDDNGTNSGAAFVFCRPTGGWVDMTESQKLLASDGAASDFFGYHGADVWGDTIIVGAMYDHPTEPGDGSGYGAAYVFERSGECVWSETQKLTADAPLQGDHFGFAVALEGDTAAIGALGFNDHPGHVYVFDRDGGAWAQVAELTASDGQDDDELGTMVAIYEDLEDQWIVSGAPQHDTPPGGRGAIYVFERPESGWTNTTENAKLIASDAAPGDWLGIEVSMYYRYIVGGACYRDEVGTDSGAVYVYEMPTGGWAGVLTESFKLLPGDLQAGDVFGYRVAMEGLTVLFGAGHEDEVNTDAGAAYVFTLTGPVPAVSEWGLVVMALLGLTVGTIMFARMKRHAA